MYIHVRIYSPSIIYVYILYIIYTYMYVPGMGKRSCMYQCLQKGLREKTGHFHTS